MNKRAIRFFLILLGIIVVVVCANITMRNLGIAQININIDYKGGDVLIENQDVTRILGKKFGNLSSKKRKEVHSEEIEAYLLQRNMIAEANVFLSLTGKLNIDIVQNKPIVRVYNKNGGQFYIDDSMRVCNSNLKRAANVIVANGELDGLPQVKKELDTTAFPLYHKLYEVADIVSKDDILKNQIDQIFYSKKDGFQLIPKVGDYVILLGDGTSAKERLRKLHYLYKDGFSKHGWDNYSLVNLIFDNQVICTRK